MQSLIRASVVVLAILNAVAMTAQPQLWEPAPAGALPEPHFGRYFLRALDCADSTHCLMTVWDGSHAQRIAILQTVDGGVSWHDVYSDTGSITPRIQIAQLDQIAYPRPSFVAVAGENGNLLVSNDSFKTWGWKHVVNRSGQGIFRAIGRVRMYNARNGTFIPIEVSDVMAVTWDGWNTWDTIPLVTIPICDPSSIPLTTSDVVCVGESTILSSVYEKTRFYVIRSIDRGKTWSYTNDIVVPRLGNSINSSRFSFSDSLHGWFMVSFTQGTASTYTNVVYRTTDAGETWQPMLYDTMIAGVADRMICMSAYGTENVLIGGSKKIFHTTNGGKSWAADSAVGAVNGEITVASVSCTSARTGLALGFPYTLYRNNGRTLGVREPVRATGTRVFPQPVRSTFRLDGLPAVQIINMTIYDQIGHRALQFYDVPADNPTFDVTQLPDGVYRVVVRYKNGGIACLPVVVMR